MSSDLFLYERLASRLLRNSSYQFNSRTHPSASIIGSCPTQIDTTETKSSVLPPFPSTPACTSWSLHLPQIIVDGQRVHADRHSLCRDEVELLTVGAVFVDLVDHLAGYGARPCAGELDDFLCVR